MTETLVPIGGWRMPQPSFQQRTMVSLATLELSLSLRHALQFVQQLAQLQKFLFHLLHEFLPLVDGLADVVEHGGCLLVTKEVDCSELCVERNFREETIGNVLI